MNNVLDTLWQLKLLDYEVFSKQSVVLSNDDLNDIGSDYLG